MNMVYKGFGLLRSMYNQLNPATLTGAIDIVVVEQEDGTYLASPFHVRFGKLGVLRAKEKLVNITVNDERIHNLHMKLGDQGEAFFVQEVTPEEAIPMRLITSPLPSRPNTPLDKNFEETYEIQNENNNGYTGPIEKRKRRKKRKRRSLIHSSSVEETKEAFDFQSDVYEDDKQFSEDKEDAEASEDANQACPESPATFNNLPSNEISLRGFLSDSEIPTTETENCDVQPFSDSETASLHHSQSSMKWGWGQLPGSSETGQDSSSDDASSSSSCGTPHTAPSGSDSQFRTISQTDSVEIIDERAEPSELKSQEPQQPPTSRRTSVGATKQSRSASGLYLDDVLSLEPSEKDLYLLPTSKSSNKDPPSTTEVNDRSISPGCSDIDSGTDSQTHEDNSSVAIDNLQQDVFVSLCGLISGTNDVDQNKFREKLVNFEAFLQNPMSILNDPNLVFKMGDRYMNWQTAAPAIVALLVFRQPLTEQCIDSLVQSNQQPQQTNRLMGWLSWRRRANPADSTNKDDTPTGSFANPPSSSDMERVAEKVTQHQTLVKSYSDMPNSSTKELARTRFATDSVTSETEAEIADIMESELKRSQSEQNVFSEPSNNLLSTTSISDLPGGKLMRKTTRLTSEQLESLSLKPGANKIVFSVTTQYQGTTRCQAAIFLWKWSDKIVVSDIDGTITKSDVFGQILPVVGKDWTQGGVAQLYQNIDRNGYKFIYLSARAIGQASMTKDYLNWINQQGVSLPPGPLLLSPTSLMIAFRREVIEKKPEKFKIECLKDIKALFPSNPFSAGFGNKSNDVTAYSAVEVPTNRLFTINHKGELKHEELQTYTTSYSDLGEMVDNFFPPLDHVKVEDFTRAQDYSDFTFWRDDVLDMADAVDYFHLA